MTDPTDPLDTDPAAAPEGSGAVDGPGRGATLRVLYACPPEREDELVAELWAGGTAGVQVHAGFETRSRRDDPRGAVAPTGPRGLEAWFEPAAAPPVGEEPGRRLAGVEVVERSLVENRDWLAPWRAAARPLTVGRRFLLDPREPGQEPAARPEGRLLLSLPARAAFGTGSHETTRLVLVLLEEHAGSLGATSRVADVGTGTGVLALAALGLGAGRVVAWDRDPAAPVHALENRRRNAAVLGDGGRLSLLAATGDALGPTADGGFDLVLVNVIPERIEPELPRLARLVAPGGRMILSGGLWRHRVALGERLTGLGLGLVAVRRLGEWVGLVARRPGEGR